MDGDRTLPGIVGAALGLVGGYVLRWWQGRKAARELKLLRLIHRADSDHMARDLESRYAALRKEHGDD